MKIDIVQHELAGTSAAVTFGPATLHVSLELGPRILSYRAPGSPDLFYLNPVDFKPPVGGDFRFFGGHRIWTSPEKAPYLADNQRVELTEMHESVRFSAPVDAEGAEKALELSAGPNGGLRVLQRVTNRGAETRVWGVWGITQLRAAGTAFFPMPRPRTSPPELTAQASLGLWSYTDLGDPRWRLSDGTIRFVSDPQNDRAQKIGGWVPEAWVAYNAEGWTFLKTIGSAEGQHPDLGCNIEVFGKGPVVETETLGPLRTLAPGDSAEHVEVWHYFPDGEATLQSVRDLLGLQG